MCSKIWHDMCSVILQLHILTADTKFIIYTECQTHKMFGQSKDLWHEEAEKAELYLFKVLRPYLSVLESSKFDWEVQCSRICLDWSFIQLPRYFTTKYDCKKYIPDFTIVRLQI